MQNEKENELLLKNEYTFSPHINKVKLLIIYIID